MKKLLIVFLLVAGIFTKIQAQQIPLYSQYYINPFLYNPAMAGASNSGNLFLIDRSQWTGIEGAPVTRALTIDGPLKTNKIGVGLSITDDETDIFDRLSIFGSYAYNINFNEISNLRLGLSGGFLENRIDYTKVLVKDPGDKAILTQSEDRSTFDGNFGAHYQYKDLSIGLAVPQLFAPRLSYMQNSNLTVYYSLVRHVIGSIDYTFHLSDEKWKIQPLVFTQYATGTPIVLNAGVNVKYKDLAWLGVMWEKDFAVSLSAGIQIHKRIAIGYAYDMMTTAISTYAGTTQELSVRYIFGKSESHDEELQEKLKRINDKLEINDRQHRITEDSLRNQIKNLDQKSDKNDSALNIERHNFEDFKKDVLDSLGRLRSGVKNIGNSSKNPDNQTTSYELNSINFENEGSNPSASSNEQLNELAATLKKNPEMKIEIEGYCDYRGTDEYNLKLSKERANAVKKYLLKNGVGKNQVETKGFGRSNPIGNNKTEEGMKKNRRVEFKVLAK